MKHHTNHSSNLQEFQSQTQFVCFRGPIFFAKYKPNQIAFTLEKIEEENSRNEAKD